MTLQEIKCAYDEAANEVLEEHRVRISEVLSGVQKREDAAQLEVVRARLNNPLL